MDSPTQRLPAVDILKAVASQFVVLHHLAVYGPLSAALHEFAPALATWFFNHARMAVQIFLVIGGYLSARGLFPHGRSYAGCHVTAVVNRYLRLVIPFLAALVLAVAAAAIARLLIEDESIPATPTWMQGVAHLLLLQGLLDYEALTVGAWYVAIDFQLFALMILISWLATAMGRGSSWYMIPALVASLMVSSLCFFNRDTALDNWALYFMGAYGMGAATYWVARSHRARLGLSVIAALTLTALLVDFRGRIAVALATAMFLGLYRPFSPTIECWMASWTARKLAATSYSLFLVHYPVLLLGNAIYVLIDVPGSAGGMLGLLATWMACMLAAACFFHWVEQPTMRIRISVPFKHPVPNTSALRPSGSRVFAS